MYVYEKVGQNHWQIYLRMADSSSKSDREEKPNNALKKENVALLLRYKWHLHQMCHQSKRNQMLSL